MGKKQKKIHTMRKYQEKKFHAKKKVKKKFMQKEGPIVTFSHVVKKKIRGGQRGSPEKKIPAQAVSEKKKIRAS